VRFIQGNPFVTPFALSHVRKATRGAVSLRNCQPFVRELGGAWHGFAHNGDLPGIADALPLRPGAFRPVGETDSEQAFCALLERLRPLWQADRPPDLPARRRVVEAYAAELRALGPANFLYCDGDALFAHADRRHQDDGTIRPPGLWWIARRCPAGGELATAGLRIQGHDAEQEVTLFASVPLTAEGWTAIPRGTVMAARCGRTVPPASP
jgi:glutamine amidotransferase